MIPLEPVVIMLSGGLNSLTAATQALPGADPHFLFFNHGQPAAKAELTAVRRLADALAAKLHAIKLPSTADIAAESQTKPASPRATLRTPERKPRETQPDHHAPGVILTMFGVALQLARQLNAHTIVTGLSQAADEAENQTERGAGHPESRHIFVHAAATAMKMALPPKRRIEIETPFMDMPRPDVVRVALRLGAPLHLSWSCHTSNTTPCNHCPGCLSRAAAFDEIGIEDPILLPTA